MIPSRELTYKREKENHRLKSAGGGWYMWSFPGGYGIPWHNWLAKDFLGDPKFPLIFFNPWFFHPKYPAFAPLVTTQVAWKNNSAYKQLKTKDPYFPLYWLFERDPYNGVWKLDSISFPTYTQLTTRGCSTFLHRRIGRRWHQFCKNTLKSGEVKKQ